MRKIILSLLGSTLVVASMANAAMAAEHHTRHERMYTGERAWDVLGWYNPSGANLTDPRLADQSAFGTVSPWRSSGLRPDDWRQSVNGG
jgi:Ni/Co efflux regulator RcnB